MSLRKNFIYNIMYQMLAILLPIITVPYVSRVLGPTGIGDYSYTSSYAQYFVLLGMVGIALYGNRQIAYKKGDIKELSKEFWNIYFLQFITTMIALIGYLFFFVIINDNNKFLYLIQGIIVLTTVFDISWFFIGYEDMKSVVIRNTIVKVIGVSSIFIFVKQPNDVWLYSLILAVTNLLGQVSMWLNLSGKVVFIKPKLSYAFKHLRPAAVLFISQLACQIYLLLDKIMLGYMDGVYQVGMYENSQKTIKIAITLITSLGVVMLPRMSSLFYNNRIDEVKVLIKKSMGFVNFLAYPMVFGLIIIADGFSVWFYGSEFNGISLLLKVGSLLAVAIGWGSVLGVQVLIPIKKEKEFTIAVVCGAIINFILNLFLIKNLGALGTTIASVVAEFTVSLVELYYIREYLDVKTFIKSSVKPLIGSIIMFIILKYFIDITNVGILWTCLQVALGGIIYIFVMFLFKDEFIYDGIKILKKKINKI